MIDKTNTPDEVLDLVDENDNIIGEVTKKEANSDPSLYHREIVVLLYDDKNRVLLQQRSLKKKVYPGLWTETCAGHVPKGASYEKTAHQELKEEIGFDTDLKFVGKEICRFPNETHFDACYLGKYSGEKINLEKEEVEKVKFVSEEEFDQMVAEGVILKPSTVFARKFWQGETSYL